MEHPGDETVGVDRFQAVIFDCDGVLVDSEPISARTLVLSLRDFGFPIDEAYVHANYLGRSFSAIEQDYEAKTGAPLPKPFLAHWQKSMFAAFRRELRAITGVAAVLERLTVPYAVVSSSLPERLSICLRMTGLERYFGERIFSAAMVTRGKPAPDLFLLAAERIGGIPSRMLAIEDSVSGIKAARAAGMTVWGFTGGAHFEGDRDGAELLASGAERAFDDMRQLLGPTIGRALESR